jgi:hypothetical protein
MSLLPFSGAARLVGAFLSCRCSNLNPVRLRRVLTTDPHQPKGLGPLLRDRWTTTQHKGRREPLSCQVSTNRAGVATSERTMPFSWEHVGVPLQSLHRFRCGYRVGGPDCGRRHMAISQVGLRAHAWLADCTGNCFVGCWIDLGRCRCGDSFLSRPVLSLLNQSSSTPTMAPGWRYTLGESIRWPAHRAPCRDGIPDSRPPVPGRDARPDRSGWRLQGSRTAPWCRRERSRSARYGS